MTGGGGRPAPPLRSPGFKARFAAGCSAAAAALAAVASARRRGRGHRIDLANWWVLLSVPDQATRLSLWEYSQDETRRHGHHRQGSYPMGHFRCADGYVGFTGSLLAFWPRVAKMLEMPELRDDPHFTDPRQRPFHHDDFDAIFLPWCLDRTMAEIVGAAQAAGVP